MAVALVPFSESKDAITIGLTAAGVKRAPRELPPAQSTSKPSLLCVRETETSRKFDSILPIAVIRSMVTLPSPVFHSSLERELWMSEKALMLGTDGNFVTLTLEPFKGYWR